MNGIEALEDDVKYAGVPDKWHVGRRKSGDGYQFEHAFWLRRTEDGGIKISGAADLSDAEKHKLFVHFGSAKWGRTGSTKDGVQYTVVNTAKAGTMTQFLRAVYSLPSPFGLMP